MSASLEKISGNIAEINIEVEVSKFNEGINSAYLKNAKKFNLPGFRKGKAPRKLVEQYYGEGVFYEDAINIIFPEVYDAAIEELKLEPVDRPDIDVVQIGDGKNLILSAKVTLKPEVKIGKYKGIEIEKVEYNVSNEEIEEEIKKVQERNSRVITVEDRAVQSGDIVSIDFEGFKDGVAFPGGEGKDYELTIGSGQFIPGFEDQLIGKEIGSDNTVAVTFPEDYHAEDLKGAAVEFKVKIHSIKVKELPELDDEFAKDVSEFDTFEEYKNDIKAKLEEEAEKRTKAEIENTAVEAVVESAEVEIPQCMIDTRIDSMLRDYDMRLMQQGLNLQKYLELTNMNIEDMREQFKTQAEKNVKTSLTLEAIAKEETFEVSADELEEELKNMAEMYKMPVEEIKKHVHGEDLENDLKIKKTVEMIVANTTLK